MNFLQSLNVMMDTVMMLILMLVSFCSCVAMGRQEKYRWVFIAVVIPGWYFLFRYYMWRYGA